MHEISVSMVVYSEQIQLIMVINFFNISLHSIADIVPSVRARQMRNRGSIPCSRQ